MSATAQKVEVSKREDNGESQARSEPSTYLPLMNLRDEIDRVFDRFLGEGWMTPARPFRGLWDWPPFKSMGLDPTWFTVRPRTDTTESEDEYELTAELPGMSEKDIEVTITGDILSLKGEKKSERETKEKDYHVAERSYGSVRRSFTVPSGVDTDKVSASFSNGVLKVHLPKTKEARSRSRKVSVKGD